MWDSAVLIANSSSFVNIHHYSGIGETGIIHGTITKYSSSFDNVDAASCKYKSFPFQKQVVWVLRTGNRDL